VPVPYDAHELEARWQARWDADRLYEVTSDAPRVFTNLVEFPYPSGEGLHVGHVLTYCGADSYGRWRRMRGDTVFQPIGFDAFGINAENYARKVGEHPRDLIARTSARMRAQLSTMGCGWDWSRTLSTSDPAYYRWTQWLFIRLFEAGLAHRAEGPVIWCPQCETVLAREQTEAASAADPSDSGPRTCERCDTVVTERVLTQWYLRTTAYAERLHAGLDDLDWPGHAKNRQRRWIDNLHDWLISRQRYWGPPIPIVHCGACGPVPVPDADLPVLLPDVDDWTGVSPLARVEEWVSTTCPACGGPGRRETDVADTFFDSSWYFLRYPSVDRDDVPWDCGRTERFLPVGLYAGGREHATRHHLYARFVTMALHDLGLVGFDEPFPRLRVHGDVLHEGRDMSKSRGNVVNPDDYIAEHGADVLRTYVLFCSRWEEGGDFRDEGIVGVERFFARLWRRVVEQPDGTAPADAVIDRVDGAMERLRPNVAVAALMEHVRTVDARTLVLLLAPIAPYLAEELWARLGGSYSVHTQPWPKTDRNP
jgi:leucyl-tRNA synthetase